MDLYKKVKLTCKENNCITKPQFLCRDCGFMVKYGHKL